MGKGPPDLSGWLIYRQTLGGCSSLHTNSAPLLGHSGLDWVKLATHLPTVETVDKGRPVPLGASGEWLPLLRKQERQREGSGVCVCVGVGERWGCVVVRERTG